MRRRRPTHSREFKAKVALAACHGDLTMAELVKKFDVHPNQMADWKSSYSTVRRMYLERVPERTKMLQKRFRNSMPGSVS